MISASSVRRGFTLVLPFTVMLASHAQAAKTVSTCETLFSFQMITTLSVERPQIHPPGPGLVPEVLSAFESKLRAKRLKEAAEHFKTNLLLPPDNVATQMQLVADGHMAAVKAITIADIVQHQERVADIARNYVVKTFTTLAKRLGRIPSEAELAGQLNLSTGDLQALFGEGLLFKDLKHVKDAAMRKTPQAFDRVIDTMFFTQERLDKMEKAIRERSRLIVTTAVAGSPVNLDFLASLRRAAQELDAEIFVFPANMQTFGLDPILLETPGIHIITNAVTLTPNLNLNSIKIIAKQINPLMGLDRIGPRGQSQIVGSPKMHLRTVATIDNELDPHFLSTTGAITEPIYNSKLYIQGRTDVIAANDHVMGALILEKSLGSDDMSLPGDPSATGFYHFRHIEYVPSVRGFTDLNRFYSTEGSSRADIAALTFPDVHVGVTDPYFAESLRDVIRKLRPRRIALHDLFNGHSVSHHERAKLINSAIKYKNGILDLEQELKSVVVFLNALLSVDSRVEIRIVLSNHDLWLNRWLNDGQFMKEDHNRKIGIELAAVMASGNSPLEYALKKFGLENPKRVVLLQSGSWKESGVELGQHGHVGANGAKGSMNSMARAADRIVFGHTHTTQRTNFTVNVGTATILRQDYNSDGASSWSQSFAAISAHGEIQLFVLRHGEWWTRTPVPQGDSFFPAGYPYVVPNNNPFVGQQIDQYSSRAQ